MNDNFHVNVFTGGVHPYEGKHLTSGKALKTAPLLGKYIVPLQQHIGAPPVLIVKKGDPVKKGQRIADAGGFVSALLHSPTSGTVGDVFEITGPTGAPAQAVEIISDGLDEWGSGLDPIPDWMNTDREILKQRIIDAGIVGMGGAAFPTHVKLSPPPEKPIDTLILNGAECEPYLTADHRLMLERPELVLSGALIEAKILKIKYIYIGVEKNKPDAIEKLQSMAGKRGIEVVPLRVRYPQGAEKQLIYAITGRKVMEGGLPMDVGCVVQNVASVAAAADAVINGHPLIERITTVTGTPVAEPGNWVFRIGTPVSKALELCGGIVKDTAKVIMGGPMMGFAQSNIDVPIMKNSSGILLFAPDEVSQFEGQPCIHCGRCTKHCPMSLMVPNINIAAEAENFELAERWFVMDCLECGICAYVCPSHRPIVQLIRRAKTEINAKRRKK